MGVNYFSDEQVEELRKNPYVKHVSNKAVTYEEEFKKYFYDEYQKGRTPGQIFTDAGFNVKVLRKPRIATFSRRIRNQCERPEGFSDTRKGNSGRPRTKELTLEEENERLRQKNRILQQENDFLKRIRFINRKHLSKISAARQQEKNTN